MKKKLTNAINWAAALVAAFVIAKTASDIKRAVNHPNPEMWE